MKNNLSHLIRSVLTIFFLNLQCTILYSELYIYVRNNDRPIENTNLKRKKEPTTSKTKSTLANLSLSDGPIQLLN